MRRFFQILLFIIISDNIFSQVGGISNAKINALSFQTVSQNNMEFEPFFGVVYENKAWDQDGNLGNIFSDADSASLNSELGFRFTYGVYKNIEAGFSLPADGSGLSFGMKYQLPVKTKMGIAAIFGFNSQSFNGFYNRKSNNPEDIPRIAGGFVVSYPVNEKFGLDADLQMESYIREDEQLHKQLIFFNADAGYYLLDKQIQPSLGVSYLHSGFEDSGQNSELFVLHAGATIEPAENFVLILYSPLALAGKNTNKYVAFNFALTVTID